MYHVTKALNRSWLDHDPRLDQEIALRALVQVATSVHPCSAHLRTNPQSLGIQNHPQCKGPLRVQALAVAPSDKVSEKASSDLQEAALTLAQLSSSNPEITLSSNAVTDLVQDLFVSCQTTLFLLHSVFVDLVHRLTAHPTSLNEVLRKKRAVAISR